MFFGRVHVDNEEEIVGSETSRIIEDFNRSKNNIQFSIEDLRTATEVEEALKKRVIKQEEIIKYLEKNVYKLKTYNLLSDIDAINIKLDRIDSKIDKLLENGINK